MYKSVIFFLSESGTPELIPHDKYVHLARGDESSLRYSGQQVRVADWFVKMDGNLPVEIENETYSFLNFDKTGHVAWPREAPRSDAIDRLAPSFDNNRNQVDDIAQESAHLYKKPEELTWLPTTEERAKLDAMCLLATGR